MLGRSFPGLNSLNSVTLVPSFSSERHHHLVHKGAHPLCQVTEQQGQMKGQDSSTRADPNPGFRVSFLGLF